MKIRKISFIPLLVMVGLLYSNGLTKSVEKAKADGTQSEMPLVYTKVKNNNDLSVGDKIIFVNESSNKAAKATLTTNTNANKHYLDTADITLNNNQASFVSSKGVGEFTVESGSKTGTYSFKSSDDKYLSAIKKDVDGLKYVSTKGAESSWTVDVEASSLNIKANTQDANASSNVYLRYNTNTFRLYKSNSVVGETQIYKYTSGGEKVVFENDEVTGNIVEGGSNTVQVKVNKVEGATASSYAWSIVDGSEYISIASGTDTDTLTLNLLAKGTAHVKVTINGTIEATATINVTKWEYNVLDSDEYFISNINGKGILGGDLSNVVDADLSEDTDVFTFEKAYKGDNTYWISNGEKYLTFRKNVYNDGKNNSAIILTDNKVDFWIIEKSGEYYNIYTTSGQTKVSLAQNEDLNWFAFSTGTNLVALFKKGNLEFKEFEIAKTPTSSLYLGDDFAVPYKRSGLLVNVVFTNGYKKEITNEVAWGKLQADGSVTGTIEILGEEKTVTVTGLKVYCPVKSTFTVTGLKDKYFAGEEVKGLTVKVDYNNGTSTQTARNVDASGYVVEPSVITEETTKIKVSLVVDPTIYVEQDIEIIENKWVPASVLGAGDEILLTSKGDEGVMVSMSGNNPYTKLKGQKFDFAPVGENVFTLESAGSANKFYLKDNNTNSYLNTNIDGVLSFGRVETIDLYLDSQTTTAVPYKLDGESTIRQAYVTYNGEAFSSFEYLDGTSYIVTNLDFKTGSKDVMDLYVQTYINEESKEQHFYFDIYDRSSDIIRLVNPYTSSVGDKTAFTFTYEEPVSEEESPWWDISWSGGHIGYNHQGSEFTTENASCLQDIMVYRNNEIEIKANVTKLTVKPTFDGDVLKVKQGETFDPSRIIVTATYDNGTHAKVAYPSYTFEGLDTSVVGEQTVTVKYGGKTATFKLLVTGSVSKVTINNSDAQLQKNIFTDSEPFQINTTVEGTLKNDEPLKYTSSDPTILSIDETGLATPHKGGTVIVTVTDYYEVVSDSKTVNVRTRLTGVELDEESIEIKTGATATLTATALPQGAVSTFNWESSDESVAKVNSGVVTGVNPGTATITVKAGNYQATCEVTVVAEVAESISITAQTDTIDIGETIQLSVTILPTNTYDKNVTWTSLNPAVATVNNSGVVKGVSAGNVMIKVTTSNGKINTFLIKVRDLSDPVEDESKGCGGSLIASTAIVSLLTLAGASLLISKRKDN